MSILGAYAVARLDFFGRRQVDFLFLSVYLFPPILLAIPLFVAFSRLGLRGELPVLVIVYVAQTLPVCVYMLRNYFESVPGSLEEAAEVDGATRLAGHPQDHAAARRARRSPPPSLFVFMIAWNEFLFALLFLVEERSNWTVSLGVSQLKNIETPATTLMAGSVILTLPIIVLVPVRRAAHDRGTHPRRREGMTVGARAGGPTAVGGEAPAAVRARLLGSLRAEVGGRVAGEVEALLARHRVRAGPARLWDEHDAG